MKLRSAVLALLLISCHSAGLFAQLSISGVFLDSMVIQRDQAFEIKGKAGKKEKVTLLFHDNKLQTKANASGEWSILVPAMKAGGPYDMTVSGKKDQILLRNILLGDVFLCIGQSNMVHYFGVHEVTYADEIAQADNDQIRQILMPTKTSLTGPLTGLPDGVGWKTTNPTDILRFSVVAYYFGKELHKSQNIPIGLINASVGGTPIEAWTPESGFENDDNQMKVISQNKDTAYVNSVNEVRPPSGPPPYRPVDLGMEEKWYMPGDKSQHWRPIYIPGYWEDQGLKDLNGTVWYKKEIWISKKQAGKRARVHLGRIVDSDELYINGQRIGGTGYMYPQRRYWVEEGLLKEGANLFVIKVTNNNGKGGFVPDKPYYLEIGDENIELSGKWDYKVGLVAEPFRPGQGGFGGRRIVAQNQPAALYNTMVAPFTNQHIKGIIWYQGESNAGKPAEYENLQKNQILALRKAFGDDQLPFILAQLPGFGDYNYLPSESGWAKLRESQMKASQLPNTGMAVTIDLGEWNDIHPENKKEVGERMALIGRHLIYGENLIFSGPMYRSHEINQDSIEIEFDSAAGLRTNDGEAVGDLAIAGDDKNFVWAQSRIEGNKLIVFSPRVRNPKYVRYAWSDMPINPNLVNGAGLHASPFQIMEEDK